jgi:hypothetical protein
MRLSSLFYRFPALFNYSEKTNQHNKNINFQLRSPAMMQAAIAREMRKNALKVNARPPRNKRARNSG